MKIFAIVSTFIGALITITSAAPANEGKFYITAPLGGATYHPGDVVTTQWNNGVPGKYTLQLIMGTDPSSMQALPAKFVGTDDGATGSYKWQIPNDATAGSFAFKYIFNGGESYSPTFKIVTKTGKSPASPTTAAPIAATTGTPTGTPTGAPTGTPTQSGAATDSGAIKTDGQ